MTFSIQDIGLSSVTIRISGSDSDRCRIFLRYNGDSTATVRDYWINVDSPEYEIITNLEADDYAINVYAEVEYEEEGEIYTTGYWIGTQYFTLDRCVAIYSSPGNVHAYIPYIYTSSGWQKAVPYIKTSAGWKECAYQ